jgi:hypothetical protein
MIRKTRSFRQALKHNFRGAVQKARGRAQYLDPNVMKREIAQYDTTLEACRCGETVHLEMIYRAPCPCSHQYALGARKPPSLDIELVLTAGTEELIVRMERIERTAALSLHREQQEHWERLAAEHIRRFSHARKKNNKRKPMYMSISRWRVDSRWDSRSR